MLAKPGGHQAARFCVLDKLLYSSKVLNYSYVIIAP